MRGPSAVKAAACLLLHPSPQPPPAQQQQPHPAQQQQPHPAQQQQPHPPQQQQPHPQQQQPPRLSAEAASCGCAREASVFAAARRLRGPSSKRLWVLAVVVAAAVTAAALVGGSLAAAASVAASFSRETSTETGAEAGTSLEEAATADAPSSEVGAADILPLPSALHDLRPKILARLPNGFEVVAIRDGTASTPGFADVALTLAAGLMSEPPHLPGLATLAFYAAFRLTPIPLEALCEAECRDAPFEGIQVASFEALLFALGVDTDPPPRFSVEQDVALLQFRVPLSLLECSLAALSFSLSASEALDEAALEAALDALHGVHQTRVGLSALETAFRRRLVLAHHVLNPLHPSNRFHLGSVDLLKTLFATQRGRRSGLRAEAAKAASVEGAEQKDSIGREERNADSASRAPSGRLLFLDGLGADVFVSDVDLREAVRLFRETQHSPKNAKVAVAAAASPLALANAAVAGLSLSCSSDTREKKPPKKAPPPSASAEERAQQQEEEELGESLYGNAICMDAVERLEGTSSFPPLTAAASAARQFVARPCDLKQTVLISPAQRQQHLLEFLFIFEKRGSRQLPCSPPRLAASALADGGPGSLVAALRAAGLAESVAATVSARPSHVELRVSISLFAGVLKHSAIQLIGTAFFVWIRLWELLPEQSPAILSKVYVHRSGFDLRDAQADGEAVGVAPSPLWGFSNLEEASAFTETQQQLSRLAPPSASLESPSDFVANSSGANSARPATSLPEELHRVAALMQVMPSQQVFTDGGVFGRVEVSALKKLLGLLKPDNALILISTPLVEPLMRRTSSVLRVPFDVLPLEREWLRAWKAAGALSEDEAGAVSEALGLRLPTLHPFQPRLVAQTPSPGEGDDALRPFARLTRGASSWQEDSETRPPERVSFRSGDACAGRCEVFVDSRNPSGSSKAVAFFTLFPSLPALFEEATVSADDAATSTPVKADVNSTRKVQRRASERLRRLAALCVFLQTVKEMLSEVRLEAASDVMAAVIFVVFASLRAASGASVSLASVDREPDAESATAKAVLSEALSDASTDDALSEATSRKPDATQPLKEFLRCGISANAHLPLCLGRLEPLTFASVRQRLLARLLANPPPSSSSGAETGASSAASNGELGGRWVECVAAEVYGQLLQAAHTPRSSLAQALQEVTLQRAEGAGLALAENFVVRGLVAGDASLTAAAKWANLAAASLSLKSFGAATAASPTGPSPPPPLISTSAFLPELNQPLSLRELAAAQPLLLSKKKGASDRAAVAEAAAAAAAAKAAKAQTPLRLKVSLRPDPSRTGACFSGARRAGGSLSASKGGLSAGAVEASVGALVEFHVQLGFLSDEQLAAAKILERLLGASLRGAVCEKNPQCASSQVKLRSEGRGFLSLRLRVRLREGVEWPAAASLVERLLLQQSGMRPLRQSSLATPWQRRKRVQPKAAAAQWRYYQNMLAMKNEAVATESSVEPCAAHSGERCAGGRGGEAKREGERRRSGSTGPEVHPVLWSALHSDRDIEHHRKALLVDLEGLHSNLADGDARKRQINKAPSALERLGRSSAEWLMWSRRLIAQQIEVLDFDFQRPRRVIDALRSVSAAGVRAFFSEFVLGSSWLLLEILPHTPPQRQTPPEFELYEQRKHQHHHGSATALSMGCLYSDGARCLTKAVSRGERLVDAHPLWRLRKTWIPLQQRAAALVAAAATIMAASKKQSSSQAALGGSSTSGAV